ncbi:MAG TPA: ATP-binding cassette domain-containing protein [Thermoanaerobaculia bacterium]|nr:ATP-binding cassette domain-containing protein [Thermoanaerobaculia bacterium]
MSASISAVKNHASPASRAAIALHDVTARRGAADVLRGISFDIHDGQITAVVGRSGVGKTTLLCLLNGLLRPASGAISVEGIGALDNSAALRAHRSRIGTVFQEHALIDRLPAIDNVLLGLADMRHPLSPLAWPEEMVIRAAEALDEVGLLHRANTRVSKLSGGERQRVGIARAFVRRPRLLLADEPFASVDRALVRQLSDELRSAVARTGMTVVIVLHQIETALRMADRVIGLCSGGVAFDGLAEDFDDDAQASVFGEGTR